MKDPANFNGDILSEIWGSFPSCIDCGNRASEYHHISTKGPWKLKDERRKMMSSPFNAAPVCRDCHTYGILSRKKRYLMKQISSRLRTVGYKPIELDRKFLAYVNSRP